MEVNSMPKQPNKLINEKSPYLLQHAYNPVNWYPWSEEAFEIAKKDNKPIFLSIGYSTCHWCHVMEQESFEDDSVAKILNENFIAIKVDREERPDIDHIYMEVCQALTGSGGWPLSIFMTPDKKPFFAGTYFPKESIQNHIGFKELLNIIIHRWKTSREEIVESAEEITKIIRLSLTNLQPEPLDQYILEKTFNSLELSFDKEYGGFGTKPKFPTPHTLLFLLRYSVHFKSNKALKMVEKTLIQMYKGGIFDHLGFGFSRYSVDEKWLVPHFEKMLYDNALLMMVYAEMYQITKKQIFREITEKIITFILRDLTNPEGAFYTAIDADSEGVEGKYYTWTIEEIKLVFNDNELDYVKSYYNLSDKGNFAGRNIFNLIHQSDDNLLDNELIKSIRNKLLEARKKRIPPHLDDKILTNLNALMITSLAYVGRIFRDYHLINQAEKAFAFIEKNLLTKDNRLYARYRDGEVKYQGYLEDYAYLIWALNELFLSTSKDRYLELSHKLYDSVMKYFKDMVGGFYHTSKDSEQLIVRIKPLYDGALPSANSVMTMNLLQLAEITDNSCMAIKARDQFHYFSGLLNYQPSAYTYMLSAYLYYKADKRKIVIVTNKNNPHLTRILNEYYNKYLPFTTLIVLFKEDILTSDLFSEYASVNADIAMFMCENYHCDEPIYDVDIIISEIKKLTELD
ncbi:MAG: thioredoxin domain-containing protein [Bacilli bacterium]|nr:thioredoxin domain-containing protein [Bacilli bacterium]